jgi:hypothetical protein
MYTATAGLMFDTPEDAARAADLLQALFEQAQARQASDDIDEAPGEVHRPVVFGHCIGGFEFWYDQYNDKYSF